MAVKTVGKAVYLTAWLLVEAIGSVTEKSVTAVTGIIYSTLKWMAGRWGREGPAGAKDLA